MLRLEKRVLRSELKVCKLEQKNAGLKRKLEKLEGGIEVTTVGEEPLWVTGTGYPLRRVR